MSGNFWQSSHYQQWILAKQDILRDRGHDLKVFTEEEYQKILIFFSNLIQGIGEHLKVRQQVIATATVYFRRFYSRNPFRSIDPLLLAPTCVFLAAKVEEYGLISHSKLIGAVTTVLRTKFSNIYPVDFPYKTPNLYEAEFFLLEQLDCCLIVFHPYRPLQQFFATELLPKDDQLESLSWKIINDTLRTDVALMFPPYQIALACLHIASVMLNKDLKTWFAELTVDMEKILEIMRHILSLYALWRNYDDKKEIPLLLAKIPKPRTQASHNSDNHHHHGQEHSNG